MAKFKPLGPIVLGLVLAISGWGQSSADQKHQPGAAREIGSGAGTVGTGAAKGAGDVAKGTGKGAANLVTLHPINAGVSIGKGAATAELLDLLQAFRAYVQRSLPYAVFDVHGNGACETPDSYKSPGPTAPQLPATVAGSSGPCPCGVSIAPLVLAPRRHAAAQFVEEVH